MDPQNQTLENEAEIVERAKDDDQAFEILYNHYLPKIFGYIFKRTGNREVTEDLVSTTFMKVFCNIKKFEHKGFSFSSWVYKIATNNLVDYYRKQGRVIEIDIETTVSLASNEKTPEEQMEDFHNKKVIKWVLDQLPKKYEKVLSLKFFAELSNSEIAETMGISPNNAGVLIHRASKSFQKKYQEYEKH